MAYPVHSAAIDAAERELGRSLPTQLRQRLLRENGGEIGFADDDWQLHPVWDPSNKRTMKRTAANVVEETKSALRWRGFPARAVAIASNGTGDLLVLLPEDEHVWLWRHESGQLERADDISWD